MRVGLILTVAVMIASLAWVAVGAEACGVSAERVVAELMRVHQVDDSRLTFQQRVKLRLGPFNWQFNVDVVRENQELNMNIQNGPWFLPAEVHSAIAAPEALIRDFDVALATTESTARERYCVLQGTRKPGVATGATKATIWVDPETWLISKAQAHYWWGRLDLELLYGQSDGHTVVTWQRAAIEPMGIQMIIEYSNYQFAD
jgi:hypothetical protein